VQDFVNPWVGDFVLNLAAGDDAPDPNREIQVAIPISIQP
jgi:hypothetical protein